MSQSDELKLKQYEREMSKKSWAYFQGKGFQIELKQLSAIDLSYLIDLLVEEMAERIDEDTDKKEQPS